jgi:hypothetical protein
VPFHPTTFVYERTAMKNRTTKAAAREHSAANRLESLAVSLAAALADLRDLRKLAPGADWQPLLRSLRPLDGQLRAALETLKESEPSVTCEAIAEWGMAHLLCVCPA